MTVRETDFDGVRAVELSSSALRLVAVTEFGPRLAFLGVPDGGNLLYWEPHNLHRGDWQLHGGHRLWIARPGADESEETYRPDNQPVEVTEKDGLLTLNAQVDPANQTQRSISVRLLEDSLLEVRHRLTNVGEMLYCAGLWALTCTRPAPDTRYGVPLGDGSSWDAATVVVFRKWAGHGIDRFDDPQFRFGDDILQLVPRGNENKRMIQAQHGIVAMSAPDRNVTFAKRMCYEADTDYPLDTNIALYVGPDNFMVEMETMGPSHRLKPGASVEHVEHWRLRGGAMPLDQADAVLNLFRD